MFVSYLYDILHRHAIAVRPRSGAGTIIDLRKSIDRTHANSIDIGQLPHVHSPLEAFEQDIASFENTKCVFLVQAFIFNRRDIRNRLDRTASAVHLTKAEESVISA